VEGCAASGARHRPGPGGAPDAGHGDRRDLPSAAQGVHDNRLCFIVDAFSRRIVGWRVAAHMRTDMVLDALEMARRSRGARRLVGLVAHADAGSQFTSVRFTLDEIGARPSIGTVADSYDNALAETTNGLYKAECVRGPDAPAVWDDVDQLELETLTWVHWFNEHRLHSHCHDVPPAEFEAAFYAAQQTDPAGVGNQ
jgi:putative transposase